MAKLQQAILYIASTSPIDRLGATKLNKILLYSDRTHFLLTGNSITGATYRKQQYGPCPTELVEALKQLEAEKKLLVKVNLTPTGETKKDFIALVNPDLSMFTSQEIATLSAIARDICDNYTASSVSQRSHDAIYDLAQMGEEIPMETVFAEKFGDATIQDIEWARNTMGIAA